MVDNKSYFDAHAHLHAYHKEPDFYHQLILNLDKMKSPITVLDLGCGDGSFVKNFIQEGIVGNFIGVDISSSMLSSAKKLLQGDNVDLIAADGFTLPFIDDTRFDLIHLDSVLHHLIGKTRSKSRDLVEEMLEILSTKLSDKGFILVEEMYYESYVVSGLTAHIIFYGLKLINALKLDLSKRMKHIIPGLEVSFYSENELMGLLNKFGEVKVIKRSAGRVSRLQRLFLQKNFGHISFIVKNNRG